MADGCCDTNGLNTAFGVSATGGSTMLNAIGNAYAHSIKKLESLLTTDQPEPVEDIGTAFHANVPVDHIDTFIDEAARHGLVTEPLVSLKDQLLTENLDIDKTVSKRSIAEAVIDTLIVNLSAVRADLKDASIDPHKVDVVLSRAVNIIADFLGNAFPLAMPGDVEIPAIKADMRTLSARCRDAMRLSALAVDTGGSTPAPSTP